MVAATASGIVLAKNQALRMRPLELEPLRIQYAALTEKEKAVSLLDPALATPAKRPVPQPPEDGLILRGYCTYMDTANSGKPERGRKFYYEENPDAWAAETQSDMLWLTEAEWRALVPQDPGPGATIEVPSEIQRRFFCTIGIDYMEGSVNALPLRASEMTLRITEADDRHIAMELTGRGAMGKAFDPSAPGAESSRGCALTVRGELAFDRPSGRFSRFDLVGLGRAWGNKMDYTRREIRIPGETWLYGIAAELVTTREPIDVTPPYNMLHYGNGAGAAYFGTR